MIALPYDYYLIAWFVVAAASAAYVAYDQFAGNPEPTVMKWGFILVTLYMGPFGLLLYVLADKEPRPGEHESFTAPLWKQGVGSTIHCVAGDATGIIMDVSTDLPGLQVYTGQYLDREDGKDNAVYGPFAGIALETQYAPDAIHHPAFRQAIFTPEEPYQSRTTFKFRTAD